MLNQNECIYVAGHRGMVGAAILRRLQALGFSNIITRSHAELDLTDQQAVREFFRSEDIDLVVLAAARVGGIQANNDYPAEFIYINTMIQANVIHQAYQVGIKRLLFLGSSCVYPKYAPQPMKEEHLLTGTLEPTNEPYAIAKISGIKMCESYNRQYNTLFRAVMPANLYGPFDNFHLENSHVIAALIRKFHLAKLARSGDIAGIKHDEEIYGTIPADIRDSMALSTDNELKKGGYPQVLLWGTGGAYREFLHVDDMAGACLFVMGLDPCRSSGGSDSPVPPFLNIGTGKNIGIAQVAEMVKEIVGYEGEVVYDRTKPDGTPRKLLDTSRINSLGWYPEIGLRQGLEDTYRWYLQQ
ncbi:MAG: GDP-L-fucose synthase family protein [Thermodesulfobacteriota bacterium]